MLGCTAYELVQDFWTIKTSSVEFSVSFFLFCFKKHGHTQFCGKMMAVGGFNVLHLWCEPSKWWWRPDKKYPPTKLTCIENWHEKSHLVLVFIHTEFVNYKYGHSGNLHQDLSRKEIQPNPSFRNNKAEGSTKILLGIPPVRDVWQLKDPQRCQEVVS